MIREKIIDLFCVYTALSIGISILAWWSVLLGIVHVSPSLLDGISSFETRLAICIYALGITLVYSLRSGKAHPALFFAYVAAQAGAVLYAVSSQGSLYFPAAGSQGTVPGVAVSVAMLAYFFLAKEDATFPTGSS